MIVHISHCLIHYLIWKEAYVISIQIGVSMLSPQSSVSSVGLSILIRIYWPEANRPFLCLTRLLRLGTGAASLRILINNVSILWCEMCTFVYFSDLIKYINSFNGFSWVNFGMGLDFVGLRCVNVCASFLSYLRL